MSSRRKLISNPLNLAVGLAGVGVAIAALGSIATWISASRRFRHLRIHTSTHEISQKYVSIALNGTLAAAMYAFAAVFGGDVLYQLDAAHGVVRVAVESILVLLVYDFFYYFLHRFLHTPMMMRHVHGVHHRVHCPEAMDGLYLHPAETTAGIALLFAAMAVVGQISVASFLTVAFVHSIANIATHTNLVVPHRAFALFNYWAVRHDFHHSTHRNANYASIFPFWDRIFGTYQ